MECKYYIFDKERLVLEILSGDINVADYINLKKEEQKDPFYDPNYNFILDVRNVNVKYSPHIMKEMIEYLHQIKSIQNISVKRKAALLTKNPSQVITSIMYKDMDDRPVDFKVFTTIEGAIVWLGISNIDLSEIIK